MSIKARFCHKLFLSLATTILTPTAQGAMPAAGLPMEPATSDADLEIEPDVSAPPRHGLISRAPESDSPQAGFQKRESQSVSSEGPGSGNFAAQLRLNMMSEGFGAHLRLIQYPRSWLGITETFRYFKNEESERLFLLRKGFLIGTVLHPFRASLVSPFLNTQLGWESFERLDGLSDVNSVVTEASAGLELRLTRFASVVGQWTEAYYANVEDQLFYPKDINKDPKRYAAAEIMFNLKWEKTLF